MSRGAKQAVGISYPKYKVYFRSTLSARSSHAFRTNYRSLEGGDRRRKFRRTKVHHPPSKLHGRGRPATLCSGEDLLPGTKCTWRESELIHACNARKYNILVRPCTALIPTNPPDAFGHRVHALEPTYTPFGPILATRAVQSVLGCMNKLSLGRHAHNQASPSYPCNNTKHRNYGQAVRRVADVPQAPGSPPVGIFKPLAEDLIQK